ncbi:60S ribosomal protein L29 [Trypanosoma rangeli]|uniref:Large ribosomal subunit protein eL29 n=1 Tax=Trypanosoma rangeli TaxID=5698 RepID=A0A422NVL5_TRYRA|nr:60S ribosomal protein L29 [Trypanosoma rangeli]RNF09496.1 60S ribosomal protein L29 [Trypanosoma rangeli]|eukprot:RNF09496.1 60S ribosomal protein L29 [Trypanosoma rangeli]
MASGSCQHPPCAQVEPEGGFEGPPRAPCRAPGQAEVNPDGAWTKVILSFTFFGFIFTSFIPIRRRKFKKKGHLSIFFCRRRRVPVGVGIVSAFLFSFFVVANVFTICVGPYFAPFALVIPLHLIPSRKLGPMAKSKNHTNHNQSRKNHRNGIKRPLPMHLHNSKRGGWLPALVNTRRVRKLNQKAALKARRERLAVHQAKLK